jgi:hypothetical protein
MLHKKWQQVVLNIQKKLVASNQLTDELLER